jgi:superfamily II DNA/RNA helicase/superfamily II DNA or RNA helicase
LNILHKTTDPTLLNRLKVMLGGATNSDIAVGYFFISGFGEVADELAKNQRIRLLVGRTDRRILEEVAQGLQQSKALQARLNSETLVQRSQRETIAAESVSKISSGIEALDQTSESEQSVSRLRDLISNGQIEIRTYPKGPLHAKAYLCWYPGQVVDGSAVIGSSNFTLAGFSGNTELNVEISGQAEMDELKRWYDELWADSIDITDDIAVELDRSWALAATPPYHVYLKALYELYGAELGTAAPVQRGGKELLANYQLDAVARALTMIDTFGGCYIGDVVGLGKTFIGAEILRQLRFQYPQDGEPLIICPAGLIPMWEREVERFGLGAEVVSMSMIAPPPDLEFDEEEGRYVYANEDERGDFLNEKYPNRGPVLIDESHNFRNRSGRYVGLQNYLESGNHKVVMLSATPQNLGPRDIYRQLALYLDETDHGINIEPLGLEDFFRAVEQWHKYRIDLENFKEEESKWYASDRKGTRPTPPSSPKVPRADITDVLSPLFIRRRRRDIREVYGDTAQIDGKPIHFPDPVLDNIEYRLDRVYEKAGSLDDLTNLLQQHQACRYRASSYLTIEAQGKDEYRDLRRAGDRIAHLMGALLIKRLESSIAAFRSTLQVLINSNRNFRQALEDGFVPIGATATRMLAGETFNAEDLLEVLTQEEKRRKEKGVIRSTLVHASSDFDVDQWIEDLDSDHTILNDVAIRISDIKPEDDDKLQVLKQFLARHDVASGKILIFSEAATTVDYLFENLNAGGKDPSIAKLSGGSGSTTATIVKRFAPKSNLKEKERIPGSEIKMLIATDVISEGQNLQDCARVLNYDLHWNPVRLVQRFGRVDRIGSEHETIFLQNMWPDTAIDSALDLTDRLINRIQAFHDFIGLDSKLLSESESLNTDAMYRIYKDKKLPEIDDGLDDVAAHQQGVAILQRIQKENDDLWETITHLPDGIRSALTIQLKSDVESENSEDAKRFAQSVLELDGAQMPLISSEEQAGLRTPFDEPQIKETIVLLKSGDLPEAYAVNDKLEVRRITAAQFIRAAECEQNTPASELPAKTNERVMAAVAQFRLDRASRLGRARRRGDTRLRRYLSKELTIALAGSEENSEKIRQIELLRRIFLGPLLGPVESALEDVRRYSLSGDQLLARLEALRHRFRLNPPEQFEVSSQHDEIIRIICSDGLVS